MKQITKKRVTRTILMIASALLVIYLIFLGIRLYNYYLGTQAPVSALEYYQAERDFVAEYVLDEEAGGFVYWVEQDGSIKDSKRYSIFQANVILWLAGLQTQYPEDQNLDLIREAADYLVRYLYKGNGEWYEFDSHEHRSRQEFFWNPRSEGYIAYALFQAYKLTDNQKYLQTGLETTSALRQKSRDGHIFADYDETIDIGFRFPEHMAQWEEYQLTGNQEALSFLEEFQNAYRGRYGKEFVTPDQNVYYYHGMAIIDKLLYGYVSGDETAFEEASAGRDFYWSMAHDDGKHFNTNQPGESSDNGRDYYDKRLAMDLIEWSHNDLPEFRADARDMWDEIKRFWDVTAPYGFFINATENRKTCFTIGMPMQLIDATAPVIVDWVDEKKALFNHQATVTVHDPDYNWNDITMRGIGMNPEIFEFKTFMGLQYGEVKATEGPCDNCVTYAFNYLNFFPGKGRVKAHDYFDNNEWRHVDASFAPALLSWTGFNANSLWYYSVLILVLFVSVIITSLVYMFIVWIRFKKE